MLVQKNLNAAVAVLEDDAIVRLAITAFFDAQGTEVLAGSNGSEVAALVAMTRLRPTIIIADYRLGATTAMDEVPEVMAALPEDVTVVITTGDTSPETRDLIAACGWRLLTKPYRPQDILSIMNAA
ncbi:response regulator [Azospirillum sp.]|uniref:response regulator n=1 Tax=Azospirillum sp. TaxID=34012 RepID=UPI002D2D4BAD|nr:response regulator [Azospirillum sp.]HYF89220.1 response regulator [Azospirillum sp.]